MSLYGALTIGVAGLSANSAALSATSSNIANVNTVGYKQATAAFHTFLNAENGVGSNASAGVAVSIGQDITTQGLPTTTSSNTDLSISGNGFFVVAPNPDGTGARAYTRAGSFTPDVNGNLVNTAGFYLMGYKLDSAGNVPTDASALSLVNTSTISGAAQATSKLTIQANLSSGSTVASSYTAGQMTSGAVAPDFTRTINVYDSQGGSQPITFSFIKTGANAWAYEASYAGDPANLTATGPISTGTVSFNSDGTLANVNGATPASGNVNLTIPWKLSSSGLDPQTVSLSLGSVGGSNGLTQANAPSVLNGSYIDGTPYGSVTGVTVDKDGTVTAQFSNGLSQDVYKIPLATFTNPNGLGQMSGNAYAVTKASGAANINLANSGTAGTIQSKSLEASTVDLAAEFTNLITTQRAYSASARIITTADQMLQELERLPTN
ncbi:MAG: flagellar hook protein FlgE [Alphaproteobacteria bacterium]|jgi:flagellar hook protein FlgE|nr:flagellar hook protein FlgE [Alphaproteobacteria bacterium]